MDSRSNLQNMRSFYLAYQKCRSLTGKLSWTNGKQEAPDRVMDPALPVFSQIFPLKRFFPKTAAR
ncbi:hypothetical protein D4758_13505 [Enterocloster citroniae]|nr:hypothetical protein [Enterocloster citroniae]RGC06285.1 hypothetical protein DWZ14_25640 [Enterocloster citroniae]